jgi:hypothetical protein
MDSMKNRRGEQRCEKNVSMNCTLLNGNVNRPVILRNFSGSGLFFETAIHILPGTYIVLSTPHPNNAEEPAMVSGLLSYTLDANDPDVCFLFRRRTVAMVRRCEPLSDQDNSPHYGVAAEIQELTD